MELKGKSTLFVKEVEGENGKFIKYTSTIGSKDQSGNYINMNVDVIFNKEKYTAEKLGKLKVGYCYAIEFLETSLMVREYFFNDVKHQVLVIYVKDCNISNEKKLGSKRASKKTDSLV